MKKFKYANTTAFTTNNETGDSFITFSIERPSYEQPTGTREATIEQDAVSRVIMSNESLKSLYSTLGQVLSEYEANQKIEKE